MSLRPFAYAPTACASNLVGCPTPGRLAVVDSHTEVVGSYVEEEERIGSPIVAVLETQAQADHVSGLPELVAEAAACLADQTAIVAANRGRSTGTT